MSMYHRQASSTLFLGVSLMSCLHAQQTTSSRDANPFSDFFTYLATVQGGGSSRGEAAYLKLAESLSEMTPTRIIAGLPAIDRQLDDTMQPEDRLAKADAANLLMFISWRPDGADLLASQLPRLQAMLDDPLHQYSGPAAMALQHIAYTRPTVVVPILEEALKAPDVNSASSVGPGIAVILLRASVPTESISRSIVGYLRRSDLTDHQLIDTIVGIDSSPVIPDAITAELVRVLDRNEDHVKSRALVGIARSSPAAREAARPRLEKMAADPSESAHVRRLADEAIVGAINEDPEPPQHTTAASK